MNTDIIVEDCVYYSPLMCGFYLPSCAAPLPADTIPLTREHHQQLIDGQASGKVIAPPDADHDLPWLMDPPQPNMEEAVSLAFKSIKAARDKRLSEGGLVWQGYLVSIDKEATDRMTGKYLDFLSGKALGVRWKMSDGEYANLDKDAFTAMTSAVGGVVQACYTVEESKRLEVQALPNAEAVLSWLDDARNLYAGWPDEEGK